MATDENVRDTHARPVPAVPCLVPPIRVGFVLHVMQVAGAEVLVAEIIRRLGPRLAPVVFCLDGIGQLGERVQAEGVPVVALGRRPGLDVRVAGRLAREIRARGIEVLHAHQYTPFFYSALAKLRLGRPLHLMFTEHGRHYPDLVSSKRRLANRFVLSRLADEINGVCGFSTRSLADVDGFAGQPIEVIENGIDVERYRLPRDRRPLRAALDLDPARRYIACVARFHPVKDHCTLLMAFAKVAPLRADVDLLLAGDGPLRTRSEALARELGIAGRVRFLGVRADVPELLAAADIFALTSVSEAASITLLEAMACGLPAVVTEVGGNPDIVRQRVDGILVPRGDAEGVAAAFLDLLDHPARARAMGEAGRQRVQERYQMKDTVQNYYQRYQAAAARLRARAAACARDAAAADRGGALAPLAERPRVTFIVPVRDDAGRLLRCLRSIRENDYPADRVEIIVADNGSTDGSAEVARREGATVLDLPRLSVAQLRNRAAQGATGDVLAFVDADHEIGGDWIASAVQALRSGGAGAVGAPYLTPPSASWVQRAYGRLRPRASGVHDVEWLGSGNLAIRRDVFTRAGAFDTGLETCEDVDLCNRVRAAGHRILSDARMRSVHHGDPATLRAVFFGELWRGRDNVRVTLRGPLSARALPSLVIPLLDIALLAACALGLVAASRGGLLLALASGAVILALAGLRAVRLTMNGARGGTRELAGHFLVAVVYDLARALALVVRAGHRTRRERAGG